MNTEIIMHPVWLFAFLFCYFIAFWVFFKTTSIIKATASLALCMIGTVHIVYWYYNIV